MGHRYISSGSGAGNFEVRNLNSLASASKRVSRQNVQGQMGYRFPELNYGV